MQHFVLGSDPSHIIGKYIIINATTGKHYSTMPQTKEKAEAQLRILQAEEKAKAKFDINKIPDNILDLMTATTEVEGNTELARAYNHARKLKGKERADYMKILKQHFNKDKLPDKDKDDVDPDDIKLEDE